MGRFWFRCLLALLVFMVGLAIAPHTGKLSLLALDLFDSRPSREILFIGNSRTVHNDVPYFVRAMADSANARERYAITVLAFGGGSLEQSWNDTSVQEALTKPWDSVILQPESRAQSSPENQASLLHYARELAAIIAATRIAFIVNWAYDISLYDAGEAQRNNHLAMIDVDYRRIAAATDADLIDTSRAWEMLLAEEPDFRLYDDGNHPSVYGAYLSAIMIYMYLSDTDGSAASYVPAQMPAEHGARIRTVAARAFGAL